MTKFILRRTAYGLLTCLIIVTITFFLIHNIPGSPLTAKMAGKYLPQEAVKAFEEKYGLDKPLIVQYGMFMKRLVLEGDLGDSLIHVGRSVNETIKEHAPVSARIGLQAIIIEMIIGLTMGIVAGFKRGSWIDQAVMIVVILGICVPSFVVATLLQYVFGVKLSIFPIFGWGEFENTILPTIALAFYGIAMFSKYMRNSVLGVVGEDYILTAKAKGVSQTNLIIKHILRNAILPIITLFGPHLMFIFAGSFVIEKIFSVPGLGAYFVSSVANNDYTMILGLTILYSVLYIFSLILVDILYGIADPRIRLTKDDR
ncbi:ABC transporter permease [Maledivibacter halophilus]|uniref:Oligopeptide transport system permease protein n=1 Tax=Maledivibacter halophilus TaxID=36842 RepID=A0A1T5M9T8_9FIRM|nr:ABC transporter permease [Maledivibacter halophilus]SKC84905.1 oligopeptide transport system permease protein [Maledivibacter halophilus]